MPRERERERERNLNQLILDLRTAIALSSEFQAHLHDVTKKNMVRHETRRGHAGNGLGAPYSILAQVVCKITRVLPTEFHHNVF